MTILWFSQRRGAERGSSYLYFELYILIARWTCYLISWHLKASRPLRLSLPRLCTNTLLYDLKVPQVGRVVGTPTGQGVKTKTEKEELGQL